MNTWDDVDCMEELTDGEIDREFGDWLDDKYGMVTIGEYDYLASRVLYDTDPIAWEEMRSDWLDSRDDLVCIDDTYYRKA